MGATGLTMSAERERSFLTGSRRIGSRITDSGRQADVRYRVLVCEHHHVLLQNETS